MITAEGPKLLEYNVRFGDPETQAILVRLKTSLIDIFRATISGKLDQLGIEWSDDASACVVLASHGYPGKYVKGSVINGLDKPTPEAIVFHAGTARSPNSDLVTTGGRVLGITAKGDTLADALNRCYAAAEQISWDGVQYRRDIGRFREVLSKTGSP